MGKIVVLDELTVNKIAAGEVIERPASVIKELVENSIDAGSGMISVEIRRGGKSFIKVTDNGCGIPEDDILLAFEKHATSKIRSGDDLDSIMTLGFRGEALASIAAVSKVELITRTADEQYGTRVVIHGGTPVEKSRCGCPVGTTFIIRELFFNTPARFKFLKKDASEASHIIDTIERIALARPDISFRLINSGSEVLRTPGDGELKNAVFSIYGKDIVKNVKEIDFSDGNIKISGFAGNMETAVSSRSRQSVFINGRYIRSKIISSAIEEAYKTLMMKGKHPFVILKLEINPHFVDVNVHPTKMEVRFSDESTIFRCVYSAITDAIYRTRQHLQQFQQSQLSQQSQQLQPAAELESDAENDDTIIEISYGTEDNQTGAVSYMPDPLSGDRENDFLSNRISELSFKYGRSSQMTVNDSDSKSDGSEIPFQMDLTQELHTGNPDALADNSKKDSMYRPVSSVGGSGSAFDNIQAGGTESMEDIDRDRQLLREARYIGQVFNTYIILQHNDEIIFIDQHAAHERVLYEELRKNAAKGEGVSQYLLTPVAIELARSEYEAYKNNQKLFSDMGFSIEDFGVNSILVRALPSALNNNDAKPVIIEIIRDIMDGTAKGKTLIPDDKLYDIACKAAIKANMKLESVEVNELLKSMAELANPFTCPHGRPLSFRMTKRDLEKKFKRIL